MQVSRVLESAALTCSGVQQDAPAYLNMAVSGKCDLPPRELLARLKAIEKELGRQPRGLWESREIDIDILAMDDLIVQDADLILPHVHMLNRDFVVLPVADVAPQWRYPAAGAFLGMTPAQIIRAQGYGLNENLRETGMVAA